MPRPRSSDSQVGTVPNVRDVLGFGRGTGKARVPGLGLTAPHPLLGRLSKDRGPAGVDADRVSRDGFDSFDGVDVDAPATVGENPAVDAAEDLRSAARKVRFALGETPTDARLPSKTQRPCPEVSEEILSGLEFTLQRAQLISTSYLNWLLKYSKEIRQAPRITNTMAASVFADIEAETGKTLDWLCAQAAAEGAPLGTFIGQVMKQYHRACEAEDAERRALSRREQHQRRLAEGMARVFDKGMGQGSDGLPDGGGPDDDPY